MPDVLKITLDHAQRRLKSKSKRIAILGRELFDPNFTGAVDCFMLPGVNTLTMRPYQLREAYDTSNAGDYAKLTIGGGLEVNTSGKWKAFGKYPSAGNFYLCDDSSGEYIRTSSAVGLNRPIVLSFGAYTSGDRHKILDFGYSSTVVDPTTAEIGFILWSDGVLEVYKAGTLVQTLNNLTINAMPAMNRLIIWPCRRRELVMFMVGYQTGTVGKGDVTGTPIAGNVARHVFDDIDEFETAPEITPNTKFFVRAGGGGPGSVLVQFQPLTFPTSATALSQDWAYGGTPPLPDDVLFEWGNTVFTDITSASIYGDKAYAGTTDVSLVDLRLVDNSGAFVPDGETSRVKVRMTMTGDGNYAPFLYGVVSQYEPVTAETDNTEEFDATPFYMRCDLEVPDEPFGAKAHVELTWGLEVVTTTEGEEPEDPPIVADDIRLLNEECPNIAKQSFRPGKLSIADVTILDGIVRRPRYQDAIEVQLRRVIFELQSAAQLLEKFEFQTRMPFDGIPLCMPWDEGISMVGLILNEAGWDMTRTRLSNLNYIVSEVPHESCEEWGTSAEVGENAKQVLEKAHRLASDCVYGEHPGVNGPEFWFLSPEDMEADEPVKTLYRDTDTTGELNPSITDTIEIAELLYHNFVEDVLEAEGCEIRATGIQARTGAILQSYAVDEAAADPTLKPSERPANWIGYPVGAGASSRTFRQQEDCDRCVEALLPVVTQQLLVGGFEANTILFYEKDEVMLPVWRMDKVILDGQEDDVKTISSLTGSFVKEIGDDDRVPSFYDRRARYTTGAILGGGGTTVQDIQAGRVARNFEQRIADTRKAGFLASGLPQVVRVNP